MKELKELIEISDGATVLSLIKKNQGVMSLPSKLERLYILLKRTLGRVDDEAEIVSLLYGKEKDHTYPAYKRLKERLWKVLVESFSLSTEPKFLFSNYNLAYENGFKLLGIVMYLVSRKEFLLGKKIANYTFKKVRHYEIVNLNFELSDVLSTLSMSVDYNKKEFEKYMELTEYYLQAQFDQALVVNRYKKLKCQFYDNQPVVELAKLAEMYSKESLEIAEKHPEIPKIQICFYLMKVYSLMWKRKYSLAIDELRKGEAQIKLCRGTTKVNLELLHLLSLECEVYQRKFDRGIQKVVEAKESISSTEVNLIKVSELSIRLGLGTKNYEYAFVEFSECDFGKIQTAIGSHFIQYWRILEAFVHLLVATGQVEPVEDLPKLRPFRLNRFLNSIPNYEKNKHGLYVQVLILQMMFLMARGEYDKVVDRVEGFDRFRRRYLKGKQEFRNNCFYRLILKVVDANFNRVAAERLGKPILEKMINSPELEHREISDIEWIPYEDLWEILLGTLDNKRRMRAAKRTA
ncbi:hypothetical protein [Lewinella sp. W8]|uniref:hypothetical protein n=1 Tax=Lewinella sp. W8 TaxID=2528208 RepID=UPI0010687B95|nr:hypothetical protein [Lewinella sp. W8]MTB53581.1 hypothetical protein [Lewinella sp. W8]